jgi:hypothetical protein
MSWAHIAGMTANTNTSSNDFVLERHRRPTPRVHGLLSILTGSAALLAGCGSEGASTEQSSVAITAEVDTTLMAAAQPATTVAPVEPFRSDLYDYIVTSLDWTGKSATKAWDGTGSPGNGDPTVDFLYGPDNEQAYAFGGPTTATLDEFVAAGRAANAKARGCPETPAATASITVGGEPAIVDEVDCGVFALSATVIRDGRVYAFFTFDQPGKEAEMRTWFHSLLQAITFDV